MSLMGKFITHWDFLNSFINKSVASYIEEIAKIRKQNNNNSKESRIQLAPVLHGDETCIYSFDKRWK